jgi:hypothetical protein
MRMIQSSRTRKTKMPMGVNSLELDSDDNTWTYFSTSLVYTALDAMN